MSAPVNAGGPAFPVDFYMREGIRQTEGMTLRDYFAAQTIVGLVISLKDVEHADAYRIADAMLAERSK